MKNIRNYTIVLFYFFALTLGYCQTPPSISDTKSQLIGTWISEDDVNWKITFNNRGTCRWDYTDNQVVNSDMFYFEVSNTTPQCNQEVRTDLNNYYLTLTDVEDSDIYCYEILGVDSNSLSISTVGLSVKNYLFVKQ